MSGSKQTKTTKVEVNRSAVTGRFVTEQYTETHPKTTVTETFKKTKKT